MWLILCMSIITSCSEKNEPKSIELNEVSKTNLANFKISFTPVFNASVKKWTYDLSIINMSEITLENVEVYLGSFYSKAKVMEPNGMTRDSGQWIPDNDKQATLKIKWFENGQMKTGEILFEIWHIK